LGKIWENLGKIWANLVGYGRNLDKLGKIWIVIRFGQKSKSCIPKNILFPTTMPGNA